MKKFHALFLLFILFVPILSLANANVLSRLQTGEDGEIAKILDTHTLVLSDGSQVKLAGVDMPSMHAKDGLDLGAEMIMRHMQKLLGANVQLYHDKITRNRYGQRVAHVAIINTSGNRWLQADLLSRGFARVSSTAQQRKLVPQMLVAEGRARADRRGLWAHPFYHVQPADAVTARNRFAVIEGEVASVSTFKSGIYINFGQDRYTDFTVHIQSVDKKRFGKRNDPNDWQGKTIRVRGWVFYKDGPMMEIDHPEVVEVIS